jgi:hypothetical protein
VCKLGSPSGAGKLCAWEWGVCWLTRLGWSHEECASERRWHGRRELCVLSGWGTLSKLVGLTLEPRGDNPKYRLIFWLRLNVWSPVVRFDSAYTYDYGFPRRSGIAVSYRCDPLFKACMQRRQTMTAIMLAAVACLAG